MEEGQNNTSKTAKILGILRKPKSFPNKTPPNFEDLIVNEAKRTGFRYRRIKASLPILKRNGISLCFPRSRFIAYFWLKAHNVRGRLRIMYSMSYTKRSKTSF